MGIVIRQSIKGTIVNYIGSFVGFILTFFISLHFLTEEEIGFARVLVDAALLFSTLAQLGTNSSILRFYPYFKNSEKKDHGFFFWTLLIPFIGFCIVLTVFLVFRNTVIGVFEAKSPLFADYYNYVIPLAFLMLYISVFETNSNVLMRIVVPKFIREIAIRLMLIVVYLLYAFKILTLTQFVGAYCLVYGIALLLNIIYLFSQKKVSLIPDAKHISKPLRKDFLFYTAFLVTAALSTAITPMLNTFFLSAKMGLSFTGVFSVATYIAAIIEIPYRSLGAITQPHISQAVKENDFRAANQLCKSVSLHQLLIGSFIFFLIWINIDVIFQIIPNGENYAAGKWVVFFIGMSRLFTSVFSVGTTVLTYSKYYYYSLIFTFILTAIAITLNIVFIPIWGITGAALASLLSNLFYFFLLLSLVYWKVKTSPFSMNQLKVIAIVLALFLLNYLWTLFISPMFAQLPMKELYIQILDRLCCSILLLGIGILTVYKLHISAHVNQIANKTVDIFRRGKRIK